MAWPEAASTRCRQAVLANRVRDALVLFLQDHDDRKRDRVRKRRTYARAGIPIGSPITEGR